MPGGALWVVATPIGNLDDLSPRAAAALRDADLVACEDTRRTAGLLRHAGSTAPMVPAHAHNEAARAADLCRRMLSGQRVALVSDAGAPGVSDPGARVVEAALAAGIPVTAIPGPSAVQAALAASGLPADRYAFVGFFPRRPAERRELLATLADPPMTLVGFESPRRLPGLLADLAALDADRVVAVCRELTKLHEEVARGRAAELAERFAEPPKGEVTVVVGPPAPAGAPDASRLEAGAATLLAAGLTPAKAAEALAALGAAPRNAAYRAAMRATRARSSITRARARASSTGATSTRAPPTSTAWAASSCRGKSGGRRPPGPATSRSALRSTWIPSRTPTARRELTPPPDSSRPARPRAAAAARMSEPSTSTSRSRGDVA